MTAGRRRGPAWRSTRPTVLLVGAFDHDDPGSAALVEAILEALEGWRVVATHGSSSWRASPACEALPAARTPAAVATLMHEVDGVVVTGDRAFATFSPEPATFGLSPLAQLASICAVTTINAIPLALVGVGAQVLSGSLSRSLARFVIDRARLVVVNNEESAWALECTGARPPFRVGADPAWIELDPARASGLPADPDVAGSVVATIGVSGSHGADPPLVGGLELLAHAGFDIRVECCRSAPVSGARGAEPPASPRRATPPARRVPAPAPESDVLVRALSMRLGRSAIIRDRSIGFDQGPSRFAGAALVIAQEPFSFMAAMAAGVPVVALGDEPRLMALARRFRQRWVLPGAAPGELADAVVDGLEGPRPSPTVVSDEIGRARESLRLMRLVLGHLEHDQAQGLSGLPFAPSPWVAPHRRAARSTMSGILSDVAGRRPT